MSEFNIKNVNQLLLARQNRLREVMLKEGLSALVVLDPVNILYASGARNMQVFGLRVPARYLLLLAEGPAILFEYTGCEHLARGLPTVDDIRPALGLCQVSSGRQTESAARQFCIDILAAIKDYNFSIDTIGIDRFPLTVIDELRKSGLKLVDADAIFSLARSIKLDEEIPFIREAISRVEMSVDAFEQSIRPGVSEVELWAELHRGLIAREGQYITTRLCQSGTQTFPYFQEAGSRKIDNGDLICLDTDAIGFMGYGVDFSRSFLCGEGKATTEQRTLYQRAHEQLLTNAELLKSGISFREIAEKAWKVPEEHQASRYYCIGHGLGLSGEFPNIPHLTPGKEYSLNGNLQAGMMICVESYIGSEKSGQGVKLEDQFLITDTGTERLSNYHFDDRLD